MEAEQNGATAFDTAVKRKASYHYQGQRLFVATLRKMLGETPYLYAAAALDA